MPTWDDAQYLKFIDARTRPAAELLARVPVRDASYVVDLGCGPGNSTRLLQQRWPSARLVGVDDSDAMLTSARAALPDVTWVEADLRAYQPEGPIDVLFANAVFQWLPDHARLLAQLVSWLAPGGALAFQMPHNFAEPSHRLMRECAGELPDAHGLRTAGAVAEPATYYDWLAPHTRSVDIWQTRYEHIMADAAAIVEWVKGTGLRPYLEALRDHDPQRCPSFLAAYERAIDGAYPARIDGRRLFSFPRLFVVAVR